MTTPDRSDRGFRVRALGEIAIRCDDTRKMAEFYGGVLGLERLTGNSSDQIIFFRLGDGYAGHTQILALFEKGYADGPFAPQAEPTIPATGPKSSLHHIALNVPFEEQEAAMRWYEAQGLPYRIEHFGWVGWRGVFTQDPEGNTVELVAFDPSLLDPPNP